MTIHARLELRHQTLPATAQNNRILKTFKGNRRQGPLARAAIQRYVQCVYQIECVKALPNLAVAVGYSSLIDACFIHVDNLAGRFALQLLLKRLARSSSRCLDSYRRSFLRPWFQSCRGIMIFYWVRYLPQHPFVLHLIPVLCTNSSNRASPLILYPTAPLVNRYRVSSLFDSFKPQGSPADGTTSGSFALSSFHRVDCFGAKVITVEASIGIRG